MLLDSAIRSIHLLLRQVSNLIPGPPCSSNLPFYSNGSNVGCPQPNISSSVDVTTVGWVAAPNTRSTLGITWSCLFTLFACTWTALHLNVPGKGEGFWPQCLRKMKWMALTMIAPEYTFWVASGQRSVALKTLIQLRKYGSWNWTISQAFYTGMGGIVLVDQNDKDARYPISVEEVMQLLEGKLIPPDALEVLRGLREEDIQDRSKANSFAKGLACIQFVWLGLQCAARAAQHLPFTLLELVTVAEAIITIGTYFMWWNKPLDIATTTDLHIPTASALSSSICHPSKFKYNHYHLWGPIAPVDTSVYRIRNGFRIATDEEDVSTLQEHTTESQNISESDESPVISNEIHSPPSKTNEIPGSANVLPPERRPMMTPANRRSQDPAGPEYAQDISSIPLDTLHLSHNTTAVEDWLGDPDFSSLPRTNSDPHIPPRRHTGSRRGSHIESIQDPNSLSSATSFVVRRRGLIEEFKGSFEVTAPFFEAAFLAVGFGALHTAAWNFDFPTVIERTLWRVSSIILATSLPVYFLCWIFVKMHVDSPRQPIELRLILVLISGVYVVARVYTLAECLASLRKQPVGVYENTQWAVYFPHF